MLRRALIAYLYVVFVGCASGYRCANYMWGRLTSEIMYMVYPFSSPLQSESITSVTSSFKLKVSTDSNGWYPQLMIKADCRYEYRIEWNKAVQPRPRLYSFAHHQPPSNLTCHSNIHCCDNACKKCVSYTSSSYRKGHCNAVYGLYENDGNTPACTTVANPCSESYAEKLSETVLTVNNNQYDTNSWINLDQCGSTFGVRFENLGVSDVMENVKVYRKLRVCNIDDKSLCGADTCPHAGVGAACTESSSCITGHCGNGHCCSAHAAQGCKECAKDGNCLRCDKGYILHNSSCIACPMGQGSKHEFEAKENSKGISEGCYACPLGRYGKGAYNLTDEHYMLEYTPLNEYAPTSSSLTTSENCSLKCSDDGMVGLKAGGYQKSEACGDCDWSDPEAQRSAICATTYSFQIQRIMNSALVLLVVSFISLPISQAVLSYIGRCCCQNEG